MHYFINLGIKIQNCIKKQTHTITNTHFKGFLRVIIKFLILQVIDTSAVTVVGGWALQLETGGGGRLRVPAKLVFLTAGAGPGELQAMLGGRPAGNLT